MDGDPGLNAWALDWVTHALTTTPGAILDGNAFFPYPKSIALSEPMLSLVLVNVFVKPFGSSLWYGYNFLIFLAYFASAVGGFLLVHERRSRVGSVEHRQDGTALLVWLITGVIYGW